MLEGSRFGGGVIGVLGEPGVGKSALLAEITVMLDAEDEQAKRIMGAS
jgi:putative protein kinase ArgK-like GTPase of G3E family